MGLPLASMAQDGEFGVFLGGSYYNGELNPSKHVIPVARPALGLFYDLHLNPRYSFRTALNYGQLEADDDLTDIGLNNFRGLSYSGRVVDLSGQIVFNFHSYGNTMNTKKFTPYLFVGLAIYNIDSKLEPLSADSAGTAFPKEHSSQNIIGVAMPFGLGFKCMFWNMTMGIEWSFRKTFSDNIDGLGNQYDAGNTYGDPVQYNQPSGYQKGIFNTDDWYSLIGLTFSYRKKADKNACPAMD